jgi:hypothetical protein
MMNGSGGKISSTVLLSPTAKAVMLLRELLPLALLVLVLQLMEPVMATNRNSSSSSKASM